MTEQLTVEQMAETLTGFDEIAIGQFFGADPTKLKGTMGPRSLVFVQLRREGAADGDAFKQSMNMPLKEVMGSFADEEPDETEVEDIDDLIDGPGKD